jgi:maltose alpha-D-glucosyltransferase/alpha-amylase
MSDDRPDPNPLEEGLTARLQEQRWFGSKGKDLTRLQVLDVAQFDELPYFLVLARTTYSDGSGETYFVPLAGPEGWRGSQEDPRQALEDALSARAEGDRFHDAFTINDFCVELYRRLTLGEEVMAAAGSFRFVPVAIEHPSERPRVRQVGGEQSNTSVIFDDALVLKGIRKLHHGVNPDLEIPRFLTTHTDFRNTPLLAGYAEYSGDQGFTATIAVLQTYISGAGDAWKYSLAYLEGFYQRAAASSGPPSSDAAAELAGDYLGLVRRLGQRTAELHIALATATDDPDFAAEPISQWDVDVWMAKITSRLEGLLANFQRLGASLPDDIRDQVQWLVTNQDQLSVIPASLHTLLGEGLVKLRTHGDYHLGQVLKTNGDFAVIDFEGPPAAPLEERRAKGSPLADVAGMIRSFDYAADVALRELPEDQRDGMRPWSDAWVEAVSHAFKQAYFEAAGSPAFLPRSRAQANEIIDTFAIEKAIYEADYELHHRPDWLDIPLSYLMRLAGFQRDQPAA